jgi:copper transport protein
MIRFMPRLAAAILVIFLALFQAAPASAHAQLLSSEPQTNAVLDEAPATLRLGFNEPVNALVISLLRPDGSAQDLIHATESGSMVTIALPDDLGNGTHILSWRVVSVDAHPIAGSLIFSIGTMTGSAAPETATGSSLTSSLLWASKLALFAGLFLGLGGAIFALVAPLPRQAHGMITGLIALGLLAVPFSLALQGADALGVTPNAIMSASVWAAGFSTSYGLTALLLALALVLALVSLNRFRSLVFLALLLASIALTLSGHAGAADPQWLTRPAIILHIGGILFWAGALVPLLIWLRDRSAEGDRALAQFSRLIPFAVAAILLSGMALSIVQLGAPGPAWLSPYAYILAAKLALLFALALWNRLKLTQPALAGEGQARQVLRLSILFEIILILAILGLAAGWRFTPPPRAIAAVEVEPLHAHAMDDKILADLVIAPGRSGPVVIDIALADTESNPLMVQALELTFSSPDFGIEPFTVPAINLNTGNWRVEGQTIPLPGLWEIVLDIRIDRFALSRLGTEINLP